MAGNTKSFFGKRGSGTRTSKSPATHFNWSSSSTTPNSIQPTQRTRAMRLLSDSGNQTPSRYEDRHRRSSRSRMDSEVELYQPGMLLQEFPTIASRTRPSADRESDTDDNDDGSSVPEEMLREREFDFELAPTSNGSPHATAASHVQQPPVQFPPPADRYAEKDGARAPDHDVRTLLQQQQTVLLKILHNQSEIETRQTQFAAKLTSLETQLKQQTTSFKASTTTDESKSGGHGKRKRLVTGTLTKRVSLAHSSLENQFKPEESSVSPYNLKTREALVKEITSLPNCEFDERTVKTAVKRCYESLRRSHIESQEEKAEKTQGQTKRRKYRSRRQRIFDKRSAVVKPAEKEKWDSLSYLYMTEESDDCMDPEGIILHKLPWRSQTLDAYIAVLDERLKQSVGRDCTGVTYAKKARKIGEPSKTKPPGYFPAWAVTVVEGVLDDIGNFDTQ